MKKFQDLNSRQKNQAIDIMFQRGMNLVKGNVNSTSESIKDRILSIKERIKFCGCIDCDINLFSEIKKDPAVKELILEQAKLQAADAYYPEDGDTIIKVK